MSESSTASTITACIDGSGMTEPICDAASWLNQRLHNPVRLLHAIEKSQSPVLEDLLADAETHIRHMGDIEVSSSQRHGSISDALQNVENATRVFVIGRRGKDHQTDPHRLGSNVETAVRAIHKPVLIAPNDFKAPARYMIAFDGSAESDQALDELARSYLLSGLQGQLIMVGGKECRQQLRETCNWLVNQGMQIMPHLLQGELLPALARFQEEQNIDLQVMGAYNHSRFREFFVGSNTSRMIIESKIPLLLLRRTEH